MSGKPKPETDAQGLTRLLTEATIGVTDLVEAMHKRIVHPSFLPSTAIQHLISRIAGFVFNNVKGSARFIGNRLDLALGHLAPLMGNLKSGKEREAMQAALNGVLGDYLEEKDNPLQISMQFRIDQKSLELNRESLEQALPKAKGRILLMIHGLCMNDTQWNRKGHNHGTGLAKELDMTLVHLLYNSGRHISSNGRELTAKLKQLVLHWPREIEEIAIVTHSMGGLITRSALHYAFGEQCNWPEYVEKIVFLGTPHHGAILERAGNFVDIALESFPYAKPFARLGKIRSAGITDLRYGNVLDADWQGKDRFEKNGDTRTVVPLPENIEFYSLAATLAKDSDQNKGILPGDGLVNIQSAHGQHRDPKRDLHIKNENKALVYETSHFDLLCSLETYAYVKNWLH